MKRAARASAGNVGARVRGGGSVRGGDSVRDGGSVRDSGGFRVMVCTALATLPHGRTPTAADWRRLSAVWRAGLDERIERMVRLRDSLTGCIGCGCLSLKVCPLRNPLDELGEEGPGPRLLDP